MLLSVLLVLVYLVIAGGKVMYLVLIRDTDIVGRRMYLLVSGIYDVGV